MGEEVADKPAKRAETLSMQLIKICFHTPVMYLPSLSRYLAICFPFPNFTHYWFQEPNTFNCAELLGTGETCIRQSTARALGRWFQWVMGCVLWYIYTTAERLASVDVTRTKSVTMLTNHHWFHYQLDCVVYSYSLPGRKSQELSHHSVPSSNYLRPYQSLQKKTSSSERENVHEIKHPCHQLPH